jgi:prepilin peptidase CpaA
MPDLPFFQIIVAPLLFVAAARDVATRLIPDGISIAIAVAGLACRATLGWTEAGLSLAIGGLLLLLLLPLAMRGWLGGGDVKLISAMAVGLAPQATWLFIVATAFAGGVLGLAYILGRAIVPEVPLASGSNLLRRVLTVEARRMRRRGPLPYAVAIAAGGLIVLLTLAGN